jgi:hypothetical protein
MRARTPPVLAATAAMGVVGLAAPATADAHAIGTVTYQSPVPLWLYVMAGAIAVAASVPVAALADTRIGRHLGPNLYRPGSGRLVRVVQIVNAALLVEIVAAGLFGSEEFAANPATVLVWVDLWVGLGLVSAVFGPVWDLVNPLRLIGDLVDRVNPQPPLAYPEALGAWPAVAALAAFGWMELAWPGGSHPFDLAVVIVVYVLVQVIGMALVGADVWLERAELFTGFSRLMARVSPFEWYVVSNRPCPADLHDPGEVVGCGACWRHAAPEERGIRWRGFTSGTWRDLPLLPGGAAMIVLLLAIVLFDGFAETMRFTDLAQWIHRHWTSLPDTDLRTLMMVGFVVPLAGVFVAVAAAVGRRGGGFRDAVDRYAPTLMPIVAVYFAAHYLLYLVTYGQLTWKVIIDPLERDWVPDLGVWTGYPSGAAWAFQVTVIVLGHVCAIFAAHRIALGVVSRRRAVLVQAPLIALMIAYTVLGLWILGQAYTSG